jgi:hypothetical protein
MHRIIEISGSQHLNYLIARSEHILYYFYGDLIKKFYGNFCKLVLYKLELFSSCYNIMSKLGKVNSCISSYTLASMYPKKKYHK